MLSSTTIKNNTEGKFKACLLFSAIGDALGWPTEFLRPGSYKIKLPVTNYLSFKKLVGGKWWGYSDYIKEGEYSDDTQLTLSIARSIKPNGEFDYKKFAYLELPLWLQYERGGGKSIKTAARHLFTRKTSKWYNNFYKTKENNYFNAGGNGAVMRNFPIILANINNYKNLLKYSLLNAVITHGHPRGIIATISLALVSEYIYRNSIIKIKEIIDAIIKGFEELIIISDTDEEIKLWFHHVQKHKNVQNLKDYFGKYLNEQIEMLRLIEKDNNVEEYYKNIGLFNPKTRGSGIGTLAGAIKLLISYPYNLKSAIFKAINLIGSDTDTIANIVGGLGGLLYGLTGIPTELIEKLQDNKYISELASRLYLISQNKLEQTTKLDIDKDKAYLRILAWEIGLHEMFWNALKEGDEIIHPTLGPGIIILKKEQKLRKREDYVARLIKVKFDIGQTCIFHSRVKNNLQVLESLAKSAYKALFQ